MPKTEKQRKAACARAAGANVMTSMSKQKAAEWCHAKKLDNGRDRMTKRKPR